MSALTKARDTSEIMQGGKFLSLPVKGDTTIYQGSIVALDANGYAIPGKKATGLIAAGRAEETVENKGEDGKYVCRERRTGSFTRSFDVSGIQEDAIGAAYEDGVLKLTRPKLAEVQPQSRKIAIQ